MAVVIDGEKGRPVSIQDLNEATVAKLYALVDKLDENSDPEMILACTKSISQLNTSLRGNTIFTPQETAEEKREREARSVMEGMISGQTTD